MLDRRAARVKEVGAQLLRSGVSGYVFPGATACVSWVEDGAPQFLEIAAGTMGPRLPNVELGTLFDLASLTKPVFAMAALAMVRDGRIKLETEAQAFVPDTRGGPAAQVSLDRLLRHTGGLASWGGLYLDVPHSIGSTAARRWIVSEASRRAEDTGAPGPVYSDLGYILAGAMVAKAGGAALERIVAASITEPLGIQDALFYPGSLDTSARARVVLRTAATERCDWRGRLVRGEVHDENCAAMGGVAGHAGLFGTAKAVAKFGRTILDNWLGRNAFLPQDLLSRALTASPDSNRYLGFDGKSPMHSSAGRRMSTRSIGHLGFTGTSLWCDPERDLVVALLTNRVCPTRANEKIKAFRPAFHDAVLSAMDGARAA